MAGVGWFMFGSRVHLRATGSYSSALATGPLLLRPPVTRTLPSSSLVAVCDAAHVHALGAGPETAGRV